MRREIVVSKRDDDYGWETRTLQTDIRASQQAKCSPLMSVKFSLFLCLVRQMVGLQQRGELSQKRG
jgi:hypothetical protein